MDGHVAQRAGAEIEPAAPGDADDRPGGTAARGAAPSQRFQSRSGGHGRRVGRALEVLLPELARPVAPAVDLAHRADGAGLDPLARQAQAFAGVAVVAHLRDQAGLLGHAGHHAGLLDAVGHRLLDVDVLAGPQRGQRDRRVHVVGRGDHHRVDVLALVEHHAVVLELLGLGEGLEGAARPCFQSTSHRATMFSVVHRRRSTPPPWPPMPMPAMLSFSLGGVWPSPPRTWRGTMLTPAAAVAVSGTGVVSWRQASGGCGRSGSNGMYPIVGCTGGRSNPRGLGLSASLRSRNRLD